MQWAHSRESEEERTRGEKHLQSKIAEAVPSIQLFIEHNWSKICHNVMKISLVKLWDGSAFIFKMNCWVHLSFIQICLCCRFGSKIKMRKLVKMSFQKVRALVKVGVKERRRVLHFNHLQQQILFSKVAYELIYASSKTTGDQSHSTLRHMLKESSH